jgi:hypothetical protein
MVDTWAVTQVRLGLGLGLRVKIRTSVEECIVVAYWG